VRTGTPRNALLAPQRLRTATEDERAAGQGRALSPVAVAVGAPLALLAWLAVPGYGPTSLLPRLLGVIATALLVATAKVVVLRPRQEPAGSATADPALGGIEGWLPHWPGVAGVSAASWWAARVGGAGLLATFGFRSLSNLAPGWAGASSQAALAAGTVAFLAVTCGLARPEHLLRLALGALSLTGLVVTGSGIVALLGGRLRGPAFVPGPVLPPASGSGPALTSSATAVVLLCLALVSISALAPAKVALRRGLTRYLHFGFTVLSAASWAVGVPALLLGSGFFLPGLSAARLTSSGHLGASLSLLLSPLGGGQAHSWASGVFAVACLAGSLGTLAGGTALAEAALKTARQVTARPLPRATRRHLAGARPATAGRPSSRAPAPALAALVAATGSWAGAVAMLGPRAWLVVALGSLATGALALTALAPGASRTSTQTAANSRASRGRDRGDPAPRRAAIGLLWALTVTVAVGGAGPWALVTAGAAALAGSIALGWRGEDKPEGWRLRHLGIPWGTAATALVAMSAVMTLEMLPFFDSSSRSSVWRGLAVIVTAAGIAAMTVFPATSRLWVEQLNEAASALVGKALPALVAALDAAANGELSRSPAAEISALERATRPLERALLAYQGTDEMSQLTEALVEASHQAQRLADGVEALARLDSLRLQELVEERTAALTNANRHLIDSHWRRRQLLDLTVRAAEGERARIAANLHDGPIQRLAALGLILDRSQIRLGRDDKEGVESLVGQARQGLSEEIQSLRRMMSELRPPVLDEGGLVAALRDYLSAWAAATGVEARFDSSPYAELSPNTETVIYRVVQEALANIAKHARASLATVALGPAGKGVQVVVRDNGLGFDPCPQPDLLRAGHFGLAVMRERVELAAGQLDVLSAPGTGTEVSFWLPALAVSEPAELAGAGALR
jgi:signal transduction histidine kinase